MSRKLFNPHECIGQLNKVKQAMLMTNRPFSKESLLEGFKGSGLPTNDTFWRIFRDSGIIQRVSKDKFMFTNREPIYEGVLARVKKDYQERIKSNNQKYYKKAEEVIVPEENHPVVIEESPESATESAIRFLKKQGYVVLAPKGILYTQL